MTIVSISLPEKVLEQTDDLIKDLGFTGRSEILRHAVRSLSEEAAARKKIKGTADAVILVKHEEKHTQEVLEIRHAHQNLIKTHIHTHLENHACLELFILNGEAQAIIKLSEKLQASKKITQVKLIIL